MYARCYTFGAYNPDSAPHESFFLVRCLVSAEDRREAGPERNWNEARLHALRGEDELSYLVAGEARPATSAPQVAPDRRDLVDRRPDLGGGRVERPERSGALIPPGPVELAVRPGPGMIIGPQHAQEGAERLIQELGLGPQEKREGDSFIRNGALLKLTLQKGGSIDTGVLRSLLRRNAGPFAKDGAGIMMSAPFKLQAGEVRACTVRITCPPGNVCALHVEQWQAGEGGDRDRPLGELTLIFPAEGQVERETARRKQQRP